MKMKRIFRRNQIIITTLAIMIAAAGYLNYSGKKEVAGGDVYEAGVTEISDGIYWQRTRLYRAELPARMLKMCHPVM